VAAGYLVGSAPFAIFVARNRAADRPSAPTSETVLAELPESP
jgi:hypothetical protein